MRQIEIEVKGRGKAVAMLDDRNPKISDEIYKMLPIEGRAKLWGEEVYFDVSLEAEDENPIPSANAGDLSYWSPGPALCIFFGNTQPYSPVNHIGRIVDGLDLLQEAEEGDRIVLNRK